MKVAFFDIGTNSIHMKVVQFNKDLSFEVLEHKKDMTRIGEGSFRAKKLSKRATRRALSVIKRFAASAEREGVRRFVAVATSAVRDARNREEFIKAVFKKTGIRVRVITGEEEGRLIYLGACSGLSLDHECFTVVDIGGGSAEFVTVVGNKVRAISLPLGVARLKERFVRRDPPGKDSMRALEDHLEERLADAAPAAGKRKRCRLVGTGGTMINLASMSYESRHERPLRLRGYHELTFKELKRLRKKLSTSTVKRIKKMPGVDKKRADLMAVGSVLVNSVLKAFPTNSILVSDKGIREGLILDYLTRTRLKSKRNAPVLAVQWFGQKPFFSGRIVAGHGR